jgi:Metalloenzyme superfamily
MDLWHVVTGSIAICGLVQLSPSRPPLVGHAAATPAAHASAVPATRSIRDPVVFVVVDGVRWQELFRGADPTLAAGTAAAHLDADALTPRLHAIIRQRGAALGAPGRGSIAASGPRFVSLPAYREIFSGEASLDCLDNGCPPIERTTLVDDLRDGGGHAAVFSSWPTIAHAVARRHDDVVVSTGLTKSDGDVDSFPGDPGFRPDRLTARAALDHLARARPDFLFLGLGEPDEYAHRGDYAGYVASIQAADRTIGDLEQTLAQMGERGGRTHVFVTTDHGRARTFREHGGAYPESAAVWLVAWGPSFLARGSLVIEQPHHLSDLAPTARLVLGLPSVTPTRGTGVVLNELWRD